MSAVGRSLLKLQLFWFAPTDARIYALLRIGFGIVALINFFDLLPYRYELFSSDGMFDNRESKDTLLPFSVFFFFREPVQVDLVLGFFFIALLSQTLGFFSRTSACLSWFWHASYATQIFPAVSGYDTVLRVFSFLLMLSPTGKAWALDTLLFKKSAAPFSALVPVWQLRLCRWQVFLMYFATAVGKLSSEAWQKGQVISYFLVSMYARDPSVDAALRLKLNTLLTYGTLGLELALPVLLWSKRHRPLGFLLGWSFHLGILFYSNLYIFSLASMITYFAFLDSDDLDRLNRLRKRFWPGPK